MIAGRPGERARRADLALAVVVVAIVAMMIVPLPTPLIDLLIALNLGFGVLVIAAALYMRDALSFAAFPTLLLLSTLYRLALNVSSTRLILLQGDAGRVIEAFGSFVVRGDYRVGALVFAMLTLVQFIVIARGAERVAEVSARFSLDALPGRQLAIDAELRAGTLRPETARVLRERLTRESQLFGALDGALKFVKGDAVAGIVITAVSFVGGVALGVFARGLELGTSLRVYGLLTIGDGLVTQIPALLGATSAGLVVTRVSPASGEGSLAGEISRQLLDDPRALGVGALALALLALVPALPSWPFLAIALACAALALRASRRTHTHAGLRAAPELFTLELGRSLHARFTRSRRSLATLERMLAERRDGLRESLGIVAPAAELRLNAALPSSAFRLLWRELPGETTALGDLTDAQALQAIAAQHDRLTRQKAADCLTLDEVQQRIDELERAEPALVRQTMPRPLTPTLLAQVLRLLVEEGVSVRWLGEIVEVLGARAAHESRPHVLVEEVRRALARRISHQLAPEGKLHTLRLTPEVEETLSDGLRGATGDELLALPSELAQEIASAVAEAHRSAPRPHALVTQAALRRPLRALLVEHVPDLPVVCAYELTPQLALSASAPIGP